MSVDLVTITCDPIPLHPLTSSLSLDTYNMSASREVSEAAPSTQEPVASGSAAGMDVDTPASASASAHAETSAEGATRNGAASEGADATASQPAEGGEEGGDGSEGEGEEYEIEKILEHQPDVYVYVSAQRQTSILKALASSRWCRINLTQLQLLLQCRARWLTLSPG